MSVRLYLALAASMSLATAVLAAPPAKPGTPPARPGSPPAPTGAPRVGTARLPGQRGLRRMNDMATRLGLTADQQAKARKIQSEAMDRLRKLREAPGAKEVKRPKANAIVKETRLKMEALLTPAQKTKLASMRRSEKISQDKAGKQGTSPAAKPPAKPRP